MGHRFVLNALSILDQDKLDREWVIRNILGGMAAGFGLRGKWLLGTSICHVQTKTCSRSGRLSPVINHNDHSHWMGC